MSDIHPSAIIADDVKLGDDIVICGGVVVGAEGLNLNRVDGKFVRKEVNASVVIEDGVFIGANTVVQRGLTRNTIIGENTYVGPLCNIGHDSQIGKSCLITGNTLICGYVDVGDGVRINPHSTILNRIKIGSGALVGISSLVMKDVPSDVTVYGHPARERSSGE